MSCGGFIKKKTKNQHIKKDRYIDCFKWNCKTKIWIKSSLNIMLSWQNIIQVKVSLEYLNLPYVFLLKSFKSEEKKRMFHSKIQSLFHASWENCVSNVGGLPSME